MNTVIDHRERWEKEPEEYVPLPDTWTLPSEFRLAGRNGWPNIEQRKVYDEGNIGELVPEEKESRDILSCEEGRCKL